MMKHCKSEHGEDYLFTTINPNLTNTPVSTRTRYTRQNKNAVIKQDILEKIKKQNGNWIVKLERIDVD